MEKEQGVLSVDAQIDERISRLRANNAAEIDVAMYDHVIRPWVKELEKAKAGGCSAQEFAEATEWMVATIMTELLLNQQDKNDHVKFASAAVEMLQSLAKIVSKFVRGAIDSGNSDEATAVH